MEEVITKLLKLAPSIARPPCCSGRMEKDLHVRVLTRLLAMRRRGMGYATGWWVGGGAFVVLGRARQE
jgi:hypothetical protein